MKTFKEFLNENIKKRFDFIAKAMVKQHSEGDPKKPLMCPSCKKQGVKGWTCRECGRSVCAHFSRHKEGQLAYCGCKDKA